MNVEFRQSFARDLRKLKDAQVRRQIQSIIVAVEKADSLVAVAGVKKLQGEGEYFRIRSGDYRLGILLDGDRVVFVRCLHRKEIYRYFP
ncbi:type II toxin-antitoxin system RelE/ParE family toxin [Promineifilum sp.]|uniref:type II toxin-antitoxin system RelE family toxin n=1 Tax=Promineifilum sp. TaxID=2664178 RepID=UPI0035B3D026